MQNHSAMLILMELAVFARQAVSSKPCRCRKDRVAMTVALSCSGATEREKTLHAEEIVPVFHGHHYGRGEAPVFNRHNPYRLPEQWEGFCYLHAPKTPVSGALFSKVHFEQEMS